MSARLRRVKSEVFDLIAPEYGTHQGRISYDKQDGTWLSIKQLPVPPSLTNNGDGRVDVLVLIPPAYPQIPPDGFYCDSNLRIRAHYYSRWRDRHYPQLQSELIKKGWSWFCAHAHHRSFSAWRPSNNIAEGDNLLKYLYLCLSILGKEGQRRW